MSTTSKVAPSPPLASSSPENIKVVKNHKLRGDLKTIAMHAAVLEELTLTLTLYIPTNSIGAIIGRKGATIAKVQKEATGMTCTSNQQIKISIVSSPGAMTTTEYPVYTPLDTSDDQWTPIVIRGDPTAILFAASAIQELLVPKTMDACVLDVPLGCDQHAALVGRKGAAVATISAKHNTRIMIPNKEWNLAIIQLEGDLDNVQACLAALLPKAKKQKNFNKTVHLTKIPSQSKWRKFLQQSECTLHKKKVNNGTWQIHVVGFNAKKVDATAAELLKWQNEIAQQDSTNTDSDKTFESMNKASSSQNGNNKKSPKNRNLKDRHRSNSTESHSSKKNNKGRSNSEHSSSKASNHSDARSLSPRRMN